MKALSITQPWSWLIINGIKDIENRDWTTSYRGFVCIHAGKKIDPNVFYASGRFGATPFGLEDTTFLENMPNRKDYEVGGIIGYAMLKEVVTQSESPWFRGKYGFVLTQRHPVDFIPLRGQLGLFDVPPEIEEQINEIRDRRFWESEMAEQYQIRKEWDAYRLEGDETPPWSHR